MTRGDIKRIAGELLMEVRGTPGGDNDLLLDDLVVQAVDDVCRATDAYYAVRTQFVYSGTAVYCTVPEIYKYKGAHVLDTNDEYQRLWVLSPRQADKNFGTHWRNGDADYPPRYAVMMSTNRIRLSATPNENKTAGLRWEGFAAPGRTWTYDATGVAEPLTDSTEAPLPEWAQAPIPYRVAYLRCIQFPTPENQARKNDLKEEYRVLLGKVERHAAVHYDSEEFGHYPDFAASGF